MSYVTKEDLAIEIENYHRTKQISPTLQKQLVLIVEGVTSKYAYEHNINDDVKQEIWLLLLRHLHKVRVDKSPFNYLTTMCINVCRHAKRKQNFEMKKIMGYIHENQHNLPEADGTRKE
jgi:DNA-directed RNA polymerase specialized sigma24 family protein